MFGDKRIEFASYDVLESRKQTSKRASTVAQMYKKMYLNLNKFVSFEYFSLFDHRFGIKRKMFVTAKNFFFVDFNNLSTKSFLPFISLHKNMNWFFFVIF